MSQQQRSIFEKKILFVQFYIGVVGAAATAAGVVAAGGMEMTFLNGLRAARLNCTTGSLFLSFFVCAVAL